MRKTTLLLFLGISLSVQAQLNLRVADSLYALGDYKKAIEIYSQDVSMVSQMKMAQSYTNLGLVSEALKTYRALTTQYPNASIAQYKFALLSRQEKKYTTADSLLGKLIEKSPDNTNFLYQLGLSNEAQNKPEALATWQFILLKDSLHFKANYKMAYHHVKKANFDDAAKYIESGLRLQPDDKPFLTLQGLAFFYKKDFHNALPIFEKLLALGQQNEQVHEKLAESYMKTNQFEKAIRQYDILLENYDAKNPNWNFDIGKAYAALKDTQRAIEYIEISKELLNPSLANHYLTLATLYKREKDYKNVYKMMKQAVEEAPSSDMIRYQYAVAADTYFEDKASIVKFYEGYLKQFPEGQFNELAKQRVQDLKKQLHYQGQEKE